VIDSLQQSPGGIDGAVENLLAGSVFGFGALKLLAADGKLPKEFGRSLPRIAEKLQIVAIHQARRRTRKAGQTPPKLRLRPMDA